MKSKFQKLSQRTKEVATTYTGTFIVIMLLNQLLFFGFCLNPICIIAAMPHVLFITVIVGTWLEKEKIASDKVEFKDFHETKTPIKSHEEIHGKNFKASDKLLSDSQDTEVLDNEVIHFDSFKEANTYASKNLGLTVTRNPDGSGFIAYRKTRF